MWRLWTLIPKRKKKAHLENWSIVRLPDGSTALHGEVYGNPKFRTGQGITTTRIVRVELVDGDPIVSTVSGSLYVLGQIDPEYDRARPGAHDRLLRATK